MLPPPSSQEVPVIDVTRKEQLLNNKLVIQGRQLQLNGKQRK